MAQRRDQCAQVFFARRRAHAARKAPADEIVFELEIAAWMFDAEEQPIHGVVQSRPLGVGFVVQAILEHVDLRVEIAVHLLLQRVPILLAVEHALIVGGRQRRERLVFQLGEAHAAVSQVWGEIHDSPLCNPRAVFSAPQQRQMRVPCATLMLGREGYDKPMICLMFVARTRVVRPAFGRWGRELVVMLP